MHLRAIGFVTLAGLSAIAAPAAGAPDVVVSIKPIHSLVAGVMAEVGEPTLLLSGATSPHDYSLRPSDARRLDAADVVFWVGAGLETFLIKPLDALAGDASVVALSGADGVELLPTRAGGLWEEHRHGEHAEDEHAPSDMHLWLDPYNAQAIVGAIASALAAVDAENAATYDANSRALQGRLAALDEELRDEIAPVAARPFVVFHDAYGYFAQRYGLNEVGSITIDPQRRPGAQRLTEMRARLQALGAACVFAEPQFEPALVDTVIEGSAARKGVLDPLGATLAAGPQQYFQLLQGLAAALRSCLDGQSG